VTPVKRRAAPVRYSARTYAGSKIVELVIGENLTRVISCARRHHSQSGQPVWVWRLKDGKTILEIGGRPLSSLRAVLPAAPAQPLPELPVIATRQIGGPLETGRSLA
jgi:hypothetical protein